MSVKAALKINPYYFIVPFLYPLKMSEKLGFSDIFRGYRNGTFDLYGLKGILYTSNNIDCKNQNQCHYIYQDVLVKNMRY